MLKLYIYYEYVHMLLVLITFVVILAYNFEMAAILVLFFFCSSVHIGSHRNFIFDMNMHICF